MNKKSAAVWKWILLAILVIALILFTLYNICHNDKFWDASAVNIITILIAVVISYFLVQKKSDKRKQKDILLDLMNKLELQISSEKAYNFAGQTTEEIMMRKRDISNKIHILSEVQDSFSLQDEIKFICDKFDEYDKLISDHIADLEYLKKSQNELRRPLDLISNKLVSMSINMYK